MSILDRIFNRKRTETRSEETSPFVFSIMGDGITNFYTPSGQFLYNSDMIQQCIRCIANEMSKVTPRHVIKKGGDTTSSPDSLDYILQHPNGNMTLSDFLSKITWTLFLNSNAFVLPVWNDVGELISLNPLPSGEGRFDDATVYGLERKKVDVELRQRHTPSSRLLRVRLVGWKRQRRAELYVAVEADQDKR